ncbi:MAG: hypothetical protein ACOZB0_04530 [Pseudomonadota bacterium]
MRARLSRLGLWLGSLLLVGLANLIAPFSILRGSERGWGVAQANDQALNAALGGSPREYLSTACARAQVAGKWWGRWSCRIFDLFDPGHCEKMLGEDNDHMRGAE